jgi:outer membrane receptor for ferrienterochelin and colicin
MRTIFNLIVLVLLAVPLNAQQVQQFLRGTVMERGDHQQETPLAGAQVYWLGTASGTIADTDGHFSLPLTAQSNKLVVHYIGYRSDTVVVSGQIVLRILLQEEAKAANDVNVVGERSSTYLDYKNAHNVQVLTTKELFKAACCNLSESFQTNASIDVSFTDAITGTKQIEMLGLSGIYTQTTIENLPFIRGLSSNTGLSFIPGSWIENINVSKGVGSVANGYESITGQIDVDLRKPQNPQEKTLFLNLYGNQNQRFEGSLNYRRQIDDHVSSLTFLHVSTQKKEMDENGDGFLDLPKFTTYDVLQRFFYGDSSGLQGQVAAQYVNDSKHGGTVDSVTTPGKAYLYKTDIEQIRIFGKTGFVFSGPDYKSLGVQWSLNRYRNSSLFGSRAYNGDEATGYLNILYQYDIGKIYKIRFGTSFLFDQFDETFDHMHYTRTERVPGTFFEYTYSPNEDLSIIGGVRVDEHNMYGTMLTPRLHIRYTPQQDWVLRLSAGHGYRTANIFTENATAFASARTVVLTQTESSGYGLQQESAWNYGLNLTHYFEMNYHEATLTFDAYRTQFNRQVVADLDANPQQVRFYSVEDGSYSNSFQMELDMQPLDRIDTRIAYRYLDVQQFTGGVWRERPFTSRHRALVNIEYSTEKEENSGTQMTYDATMQWFGPKRIPSTASNPAGLQMPDRSPSFALVNAQITRTFYDGFDLYAGAENIFNYTQQNTILDWEHPGSQYFDASLIWGPVSGRMIYAGIRLRI